MKQLLFATCLALFLAGSTSAKDQINDKMKYEVRSDTRKGVIIKVISAGELVVWEKDELYPFTLYGIDLPSPDSALGLKAKKIVSELVFNKLLTVHMIKGKSDTAMGIVIIRGKCMNQTLVGQGIARVNKNCRQEPYCSQWANVQKK